MDALFIGPIVLMMDCTLHLEKIEYIRDQVLTRSDKFCKLCFSTNTMKVEKCKATVLAFLCHIIPLNLNYFGIN